MASRLGGSQISSLLESVPGIASVLRSPVADAIVNMVRAGAGLGTFDKAMAKELVQYAVRRGLLPIAEGDDLLAEVEEAVGKRGKGRAARSAKRPAKKATAGKSASSKKASVAKKKTAKKPSKSTPKKAQKPARASARKPNTSKAATAKRR